MLALAGVAAGIVGCGSEFGAGSQQQTATTDVGKTATVVRVVDGDTVKVRSGRAGKTRTVRLALIDAPESSSQRYGHAECGGAEAKRALERLVAGRTVSVGRPSSERSVDRYGRLIREITVRGRSVDEQLARDGWAKPYRVPNGAGGRAANRRITRAAEDAKRHRRGVWSGCGGFGRSSR